MLTKAAAEEGWRLGWRCIFLEFSKTKLPSYLGPTAFDDVSPCAPNSCLPGRRVPPSEEFFYESATREPERRRDGSKIC